MLARNPQILVWVINIVTLFFLQLFFTLEKVRPPKADA
jgi:hypothetical protein